MHLRSAKTGYGVLRGRALNSMEVIHWRILAFLGAQLQIPVPRVASLRALYRRRPTLHEHQQLARTELGFRNLFEPVRRQLVAHCGRRVVPPPMPTNC
jgi:hypothetical protein